MLVLLLAVGCGLRCDEGFELSDDGYCWPVIDDSVVEGDADADGDSDTDTDTDADGDTDTGGIDTGVDELTGTIDITISDTNAGKTDNCSGTLRLSSRTLNFAGEWSCVFKGHFANRIGGGFVEGTWDKGVPIGEIFDMEQGGEQKGGYIDTTFVGVKSQDGSVTADFSGDYVKFERKGSYSGSFTLGAP